MENQPVPFWRQGGTLERPAYAFLGLAAALLNHIYTWIARANHVRWTLWDTLVPFGNLHPPMAGYCGLPEVHPPFYALLFIAALPFACLGVTIIVKRLREAGQPPWLAILLFVPIVNVLFFAILCFLSPVSRPVTALRPAADSDHSSWIESHWGSALMGVMLASLLGVVVTWGI
jgi:uncharacterized membrane protein YhaH (DUF805 family)